MTPDTEPKSVNDKASSWLGTIDALIQRLKLGKADEAHRALVVVMMEGLSRFGGPESVVMQECFPPLDRIMRQIDAADLNGALRQTLLLRRQLGEVLDLVASMGRD